MDFREIARLGAEPTAAELEPVVTAHLEQHGPTKRVVLARAIEEKWLAEIGRPLRGDLMPKLKKALSHMEQRGGVAQTGHHGIWRLADPEAESRTWDGFVSLPGDELDGDTEDESGSGADVESAGAIELGEGEQLVYCFYLGAYRREAEAVGRNRWPIKIGSTTGQLASRLAGQTTGMPEPPVVAVRIRTHNAGVLEKALQNVLSFRGRWLSEAGGSEWYATNPEEIVRIYELIRGEDGDRA